MKSYKMSLLCVVFFFIFAFLNKISPLVPELNSLAVLFQFLMLITLSCFIVSFYNTVKKIFDLTEQDIKIDTMMKSQELRKKQETELRVIKANAEEFQDEIKKTLKVISGMLENDDIDQAKETLIQLSDHFESVRMHPICSDSLMNAILQSKKEYANTLGIDVHYHVVTEYANRFDTDLSAVLFNLLDNGIEACHGCSNSSLTLTISDHMGYLHIKMVNSKEEKKFTGETTKEDKTHHGYGLSIITDIANKHDGSVQWIDNGNTFTSLVMLKV